MKKLSILFMALMVSCSLFADIKLYDVTWDLNSEDDMSHYNLFVWEGLDSTLCTFAEGLVLTPAGPDNVNFGAE